MLDAVSNEQAVGGGWVGDGDGDNDDDFAAAGDGDGDGEGERLDEAESVWRCWWLAGFSMRGTTHQRGEPPLQRCCQELPGFSEKQKSGVAQQEEVTAKARDSQSM